MSVYDDVFASLLARIPGDPRFFHSRSVFPLARLLIPIVMPPPLQPSPRAAQAMHALITRMEDDARAQGDPDPPPLPHQAGPPSDSEIEQVIKSAMALAGKAGPREVSRAGTPGREDVAVGVGGMGYQGYPTMHSTAQYSMDRPQHRDQLGEQGYYHAPMHAGYLHPQPVPSGMGMGPAPSMGFGGHHHAHVKPVSLPLFSESLRDEGRDWC